MKKIILTIIFTLSYLSNSLAQESNISVRGYLDTYHAVKTRDNWDFITSRTRLRTEISASRGNASLFVSTNLIYNPLLYDKPYLDLREGYIDYTGNSWGLRAGRQIISLGVADGLRVIDLISAMDMREFLAQEYDDIRQPVNAIKLYHYTDTYKAEVIAVPTFEPFILPSLSSAWSIIPQTDNNIIINKGQLPNFSIKNTEVAAVLSFNLHSADLSLMAIYGWNKNPIFKSSITTQGIEMTPIYERSTTLGLSTSIPIGEIVLRGETAYNPNKLVTANFNQSPTRLPSLNTLIGVDWFAPNSWLISAQISNEHLFRYDKSIVSTQNDVILATLKVSKKLYSDLIEISSMGYFDITNTGIFNRLSISYSITDELSIASGFDFFHGNKGLFSLYNNNDEIFLKLKYFF